MMIWDTGKYGLSLWMLISLLNSAAAQRDGYISIDSGAAANSTDADTGIEWTTDAPYIRTGINAFVVSVASGSVNELQLETLRYFPVNRSKHCYSLPTSRNSSYLLRATFLHGQFQPSVDNTFDISIDSTVADRISLTEEDVATSMIYEYMVRSTSNNINFCLIPVDGNPFINTLELRPLSDGMYGVVFSGKYLKSLIRLNCGAQLSDPTIRYPDDLYDRVWFSPGASFKIESTKTYSTVVVPSYVFDKPPIAVMQTAWVDPVSFWWSVAIDDYELEKTKTFYVNHFFADIQSIESTDTRIIDIKVNGKDYISNFSIDFNTNQVYSTALDLTKAGANFSFTIRPESTLGPLVNGAEIYASRDALKSSTDDRDVNALEVVKTSLGLGSWTGDPCLPVAFDWLTCEKGINPRVTTIKLSNYNLTGIIPASISDLTALTDLLLDNNKIKGAIPDLVKLAKLRTLHLQNNSLSGGIPNTLASLPVLTELFLSNNKLSGPIPAALANRAGLNLETSGNVNLCAPTENCPVLPLDMSDDEGGGNGGGSSGGSTGAIIGGVVGGLVAAIVIVGLLVWCYCRKPKIPPGPLPFVDPNMNPTGDSNESKVVSIRSVGGGGAVANQSRVFSLYEVHVATEGYKTTIGEGGFGPVYYGKLSDGTELAVKVNSETSGQGSTEFTNEVSLLSRVHHKNLVSLLGYCEENEQQILIYEYMSMGTLREHLYGRDMRGSITWRERLDIALNSAKGLEYLHNDCSPKIIHRDIKSNNILLNNKLMAKVADFGISKLAPEDHTGGVSTIVRGTTGYLDPEYYAHNKLSQKSDVYSFGVVLLEIMCGRPPNGTHHNDHRQYNLVEWARGQLNGNDLESIVDPAIRGTYNVEAMWKVAELAMGCVEPSGVNRPDMKQVVRGLTMASEFEEQKTQSFGPDGQASSGGGRYGLNVGDYVPSTFNTESSYPSKQGSVTSIAEFPPRTDESPSAPPILFNPPGSILRVPSEKVDSESWWLDPKPR